MATYLNTNGTSETFDLTERYIYGSSRVGVYKEPVSMLATPSNPAFHYVRPGYRQYELSNHLGNVMTTITAQKVPLYSGTTITGFAPQIVKSFDYSPFGVTRVDFDVTARLGGGFEVEDGVRYGFNGMERDDEISGSGNSYTAEFWQYSPRLAMRWNLDPKPNPSISPYATFAGNPIMYADPLGDTVQVSFRAGGFLGLRKNTLNYEGGSLYNRDGSSYEGKVSKFGQQAVGALNKLSDGQAGSAALSELISSTNVFNIRKTNGGNQFVANSVAQAGLGLNPNVPSGYNISGSGGTIYFNPYSTDGGINTRGLTARPAFIGLGHELLGHGLSANRGLANYGVANPNYPSVSNDEFFASDMENRIRAEHFLPLRAFYGIGANGKGIIPLLSNGAGILSGVNYYNAIKMHSLPAKPISVPTVAPMIKQ